MPRMKNTVTGTVVNVDDDTAATLGSGWEAAPGDAGEKSGDDKDAGEKKPARKPRGKGSADAGGDDHTD